MNENVMCCYFGQKRRNEIYKIKVNKVTTFAIGLVDTFFIFILRYVLIFTTISKS